MNVFNMTHEELKEIPFDGGDRFNRLIHETSPYLLQHADNPVDWYPWSDEAFEVAREQNKPVFLSVGYATCHWCHVMGHESFEDKAVAELLNRYFVCIKVDREERPDIDHIYMMVTQAITGSGGWPMTVFLTPQRKPFFAGTYFPKTNRFGRQGMMSIIPAIGKLWEDSRDELINDAEHLVQRLERMNQGSQNQKPFDNDVVHNAFQQLARRFDDEHGGFGSAPKFPSPHQLSFLLKYSEKFNNRHAVEMVERTLQEMRKGGIYDQLGYGFHRYSTDKLWRYPHFEKMLYDQAMMILAYVDGFEHTGNPEYAETVHEIIQYLVRDMRSDEGGFYSAEDADSDGEEGTFYVWSSDEIDGLLSLDDAKLFKEFYSIAPHGNYRDESTGQLTGKNILFVDQTMEQFVKTREFDKTGFQKRLKQISTKLLNYRTNRVRPLCDDKILTDWNGLIMAALARAARILERDEYLDYAEQTFNFIVNNLIREDGRLLKSYRRGASKLDGLIDDYAFVIWGVLELYESTGNKKYLDQAVSLLNMVNTFFKEPEKGGYTINPWDGESLIFRNRIFFDGAIPSGNSVMASNLLKAYRLTGDDDWKNQLDELLATYGSETESNATAYCQLLMAALDYPD